MNEGHPTADDLAGYVTGALDPPRAAWLEEHLASCPPCARALEREAKIEVALHAVARADTARLPSPPPLPSRRSRLTRAAVGACAAVLAVAAPLLLFHARPPRGGALHVVCGAAGDGELRRCRAAARCAGLLAEDVSGAADVPVYETLAPGCPGTPALSFASDRGGPR
jgi:anti-sigma factor RsiW